MKLIAAVGAVVVTTGSALAVADSPALSPAAFIAALRHAGIPIGHVVSYTAASDPNALLGRPGQYIAKFSWVDRRDSSEGLDGGTVELFATPHDLRAREAYLRRWKVGQRMFVQGLALMRVADRLTPTAIATYARVLRSFVAKLAPAPRVQLVGPKMVYVGQTPAYSILGLPPDASFSVVVGKYAGALGEMVGAVTAARGIADRDGRATVTFAWPPATGTPGASHPTVPDPSFPWARNDSAAVAVTLNDARSFVAALVVSVRHTVASWSAAVDAETATLAIAVVSCMRDVDQARAVMLSPVFSLHTLAVASRTEDAACARAADLSNSVSTFDSSTALLSDLNDATFGDWTGAIDSSVAAGVASPDLQSALQDLPVDEDGVIASIDVLNHLRERLRLRALFPVCMRRYDTSLDPDPVVACLLGR